MEQIEGIHTPFGYKSGDAFGAVFACHVEDAYLCSINHLYVGMKVWFIISQKHRTALESQMRHIDAAKKRGQFSRHQSVFIPESVFQEWNIPYTVVVQHEHVIIITLPEVYHQGFSTGRISAEAINFAHPEWNPESCPFCKSTCPRGRIEYEDICFLEDDETQKLLPNLDPDILDPDKDIPIQTMRNQIQTRIVRIQTRMILIQTRIFQIQMKRFQIRMTMTIATLNLNLITILKKWNLLIQGLLLRKALQA